MVKREKSTAKPKNEIEVLLPAQDLPTPQNNSLPTLATSFMDAIQSLLSNRGLTLGLPRDISYEDLDDSSKKIIDAFMEQLKPEIEEKAKALLTAEIRDRIVRKANLMDIGKILQKRKKLSIKRKKGCIFVQFGTGEPEDEIEELMIAST